MRVKSTASANRAGSSISPHMKSAAKGHAPSTPSTVTPSSAVPRLPAMTPTKARSAASSPRCRYSASTGTNAWAKAPSANRRRKKLGMRKARKKVSATPAAPSTWESTMSRTSPLMRDSTVIAPTTTPWAETLAFSWRGASLTGEAPSLPWPGKCRPKRF